MVNQMLKKRFMLAFIVGILILGTGIGIYMVLRPGKATAGEVVSKESNVEKGNLTVGVTETGSVTVGAITQNYDLDISGGAASMNNNGNDTSPTSGSASPALVVKEVLASVGKVVKEGEPILLLTDESVNEVTEYLNSLLKDAKTTLKEAQIQRNVKKLQAKNEYESNVSLGKIAKDEYDATLKGLANAVSKAQKELKEAKDGIAGIPSEIAKLKEKKSKAEKEEEKQSIQNEIDSLKKELETHKGNLSSLQSKVSEEKSKQASGKISAKKAYEEAMVNYHNAKELYEVAIEGVDDDVDTAKEAVVEAEDKLADFKEFVGDGSVTARYDGTITSLGYAAGEELNASTSIATYADVSSVNVTVSVSEEDVSSVQIGNRTTIVFTAYPEETYEGAVRSIATSESNSSTVSYDVTVGVTGEVGKLYEGMTGNVTFVTKEVKDVLYVSNKAITPDGTKSYVTKKEGDGAVKVEVTTGFSDGVHVEIKEGLREGDVVLIESQVNAS